MDFDALTMKETVLLVDEYIRRGQGIHLLGVNADKILSMEKNKDLAEIVHKADIINADGASVVIASKILRNPLPERVAGIDLMQELLHLANKRKYSVYFIGAKENIVNTMVTKLSKKYCEMKIAGYRDGYFQKKEWQKIAIDIKNSGANLVFIGITSPIKEEFIDYLLGMGVNGVLMGVGGSFDVLSGEIKRAPLWIQRLNLEWLFRMLQEPKRLFGRYFVGNGKFLMRIFQEKFLNIGH